MTQAWRAFGELVPFALAIVVAASLGVAVVHQRRRRAGDERADLARTASTAAVVVTVLAVAGVTLLPRGWGASVSHNWVPFRSIWELTTGSLNAAVAVRNVAGNVVLFAPVGAALGWWAALRGRPIIGHAVRIGLALSVSVEALQLALPLGRSVDVDDVVLNVLGTAVGAAVIGIVIRARRPSTVVRPDGAVERA